jgi:polysaccharide export outer membrane protein
VWEAPIRTLQSLTAATLLLSAFTPAYGQTPPAQAPAQAPAAPAVADTAKDAPPAADATAPSTVSVDQSFVLGVGDVVDVGVIGRTDFNTRQKITPEGTIVLPLLGRVKALGLTTAELAQQTQDALVKGAFFANPVVRVEVSGVASRYVTVLGNVTTPGLLPLDRTYHLSDVIARVGAHAGEGSNFVILTRADGTSKKYSIEELATSGGAADPLMMAGDKLYVPAATSEVFYLSGQVKNPGAIPMTKDITVREAIAKGGGLTDMGSDKKVKIFRKNVEVKGVKLDTKLEPGDIIQVGERLF